MSVKENPDGKRKQQKKKNTKKKTRKTSKISQINTRSGHPELFCQKMLLKFLQISQKNIFAGVFYIHLPAGNLKLLEAKQRKKNNSYVSERKQRTKIK